jgi:catechol 2,3-dioxygenase-like lactoylglutathione lyase family enzyme
MDNVGIVVEDLDAAIVFFTELGLTLEGRMPIEGEWAGRVTGSSSRASTLPPSRPITARRR